jgi:integrase
MSMLNIFKTLTTSNALAKIKDYTDNQQGQHDTSPLVISTIKKFDKTIKNKNAMPCVLSLLTKHIPTTSVSDATEILRRLHVLLPVLGQDSLVQGSMGYIRKIYKKTFGAKHQIVDLSMTLMKFDPATWSKNKLASDKKVIANNKNLKVFTDEEIYKIMDTASQSDSYPILAIGIQLAIGGRINEILGFSEYTESKEKEGWITQHKVSKQKTDAETNRKIHKPVVYFTNDTFFRMLKELRKQVKTIKKKTESWYELSQRQNGKINLATKKLFKDNANKDTMTSHMLRRLYGTMSFNLHGKGKYSLAGWLNVVLGHSENSLAVAANYSTVHIKTAHNIPSAQTESKISELETKTNLISDAINTLSSDFENINSDLNKKTTVNNTNVNISRNIRLKDGRAIDRLRESVKQMESKDVKITNTGLRALGFGSLVVGKFMKTYKHK